MQDDIHDHAFKGLKAKDPNYAVLYKYQAFQSYTCESLRNNLIKYSTHEELNDPFDLRISFPEPFGPTYGDIWKLRDLIKPLAGTGYDVPADAAGVAEYAANHPNLRPLESLATLAAQLGLDELREALTCIEPTEKWCGNVLAWAMEITRLFAQNTRVFCLTSEPQSHLMWGYYGNGLRGFCIGYGCFVGQNPIIVERVQYSARIKPFDPLESALDPWKTAQKILYTKPSPWKHESEWRARSVVFGSEEGEVTSSLFPIVKVIIGYRMPADQREAIMDALSSSPASIWEALPIVERGYNRIGWKCLREDRW